jgi:hypothetical protein
MNPIPAPPEVLDIIQQESRELLEGLTRVLAERCQTLRWFRVQVITQDPLNFAVTLHPTEEFIALLRADPSEVIAARVGRRSEN